MNTSTRSLLLWIPLAVFLGVSLWFVTAPSPLSDTSTPAEQQPSVITQPSRTTGDGTNDFGACNADAQTYCSGFYTNDWKTFAAEEGYTSASWKLGLVDCLGAHRTQTSQACNDSLDRRQALNDDLNTTCATDRRAYCAGVEPKPGSEPQVDCLKEHYTQLSSACASALDAHEAAKPTN